MTHRRLGGGVGVIKVQRDSIIFKAKPAHQDQSAKASISNSQSIAAAPSRTAAINTSLNSALGTQGSTNTPSPWPYAMNSLPSLLANVSGTSNMTANSSFTSTGDSSINITNSLSQSSIEEFPMASQSHASNSSPIVTATSSPTNQINV